MTEMKIMRYGGPEVFRAVEAPPPPLLPGSVRIRVSAAGVNFFDVHMRTGLGVEAPRLPFAPGFEQALGGESLAPFVEQRHQRADARRLQRLDDDLIR